jgi:DNA topoisomerase VI subunit A
MAKNPQRFQVFYSLLKQIKALHHLNEQMSKRAVFYSNVTLFKSQSVVDHALEDLACSLETSRNKLKIVLTLNFWWLLKRENFLDLC